MANNDFIVVATAAMYLFNLMAVAHGIVLWNKKRKAGDDESSDDDEYPNGRNRRKCKRVSDHWYTSICLKFNSTGFMVNLLTSVIFLTS